MNLLTDRLWVDDVESSHLFDYFEKLILLKCEQSFPFGLKFCSILKASACSPSEGLFKNVLMANQQQSQLKRDELLRNIQEKVEVLTNMKL